MNWWQQKQQQWALCAWAILLLSSVQLTTPLIVPQELPSILSLVYSNIPPVKKGTDSRLGFGFRLGEHADFQVVLELGPQKETRPIGDQETESTFSKRQVSKAQQIALMRQQLRQQQQQQYEQQQQQISLGTSTERAAASWLEMWSNGINANKKKSKNPNVAASVHKKQQQQLAKKPIAAGVQHMPTLPTMAEHSLQQLQQLYKMATTTAVTPQITTTTAIVTTTSTTPKPFNGGSLNLGGPAGFALPASSVDQPSNLLNNFPARKSQDEITAELMDVSLDDNDKSVIT